MFKNQNSNNHGFPYLATLETSETTSEVLERSEALEAVCPMKNITHWVPIYPCLQHGELGTDFQFPLVFRCALETLAKKKFVVVVCWPREEAELKQLTAEQQQLEEHCSSRPIRERKPNSFSLSSRRNDELAISAAMLRHRNTKKRQKCRHFRKIAVNYQSIKNSI